MNSNCCKTLSEQIKAEALRLGFSACGLSPADAVEEECVQHFTNWLSEGCHAQMKYMENHREKREDPRLLVEGTRSIISVALNYYPLQKLDEDTYQFAWYAYGKDYHDVVKEKLEALLAFIRTRLPSVNGRAFCDTAPVFERYWAWRGGLGWIGKNTQFIIPGAGSCFFLGELFIDAELTYDSPQESRCGNCKSCLEACPMKALEAPYRLNASGCLSYLTIENRGAIPPEYASALGNCIYGCDECQKTCPWNRFATPCTTPELQPTAEFMHMKKEDWRGLTEERYRKIFKGSAVKRTKYAGLIRNIGIADKNENKRPIEQ